MYPTLLDFLKLIEKKTGFLFERGRKWNWTGFISILLQLNDMLNTIKPVLREVTIGT